MASLDMTPSLSWSRVSFINEVNAWKNGQVPDSPMNDDGTRGLSWRDQVSTDVFECASVVAAQALRSWAESTRGVHHAKSTGFPRFRAKHRTTPSFRLRNRSRSGQAQSVRFTGPKCLRLPKIGEVQIHGCAQSTANDRRRSFSHFLGDRLVSLRSVVGLDQRRRGAVPSPTPRRNEPSRRAGWRRPRAHVIGRGCLSERSAPQVVRGGENTTELARPAPSSQPGPSEDQAGVKGPRSGQDSTQPTPRENRQPAALRHPPGQR